MPPLLRRHPTLAQRHQSFFFISIRRGFGWAMVFALFFIILFSTGRAQGSLEILDPDTEHRFGEWIQFQARVNSEAATDSVILFFRPDGPYETYSARVPLTTLGEISYRYDLLENRIYIPPFTTIHYWFQMESEETGLLTSSSNPFTYEDNRFDWATISDGPFEISWYKGDSIFAQEIADSAQIGLQKLDAVLSDDKMNVQAEAARVGIDIYAYDSVSALQSALPAAAQPG